MSTRTNPTYCPKCSTMLDAATGISERGTPPKVGDFTCCASCGFVGRFTKSPDGFALSMLDARAAHELATQAPVHDLVLVSTLLTASMKFRTSART